MSAIFKRRLRANEGILKDIKLQKAAEIIPITIRFNNGIILSFAWIMRSQLGCNKSN